MSTLHVLKMSTSIAWVKIAKVPFVIASATRGPTVATSIGSPISGGKGHHPGTCSGGTPAKIALSPRFVATRPGQRTETPTPR